MCNESYKAIKLKIKLYEICYNFIEKTAKLYEKSYSFAFYNEFCSLNLIKKLVNSKKNIYCQLSKFKDNSHSISI